METLKSLESYVIAFTVWLVSQVPLACHTLYDVMVVVAQILAFVLVACKVIEAVPQAAGKVKSWMKRDAHEDP